MALHLCASPWAEVFYDELSACAIANWHPWAAYAQHCRFLFFVAVVLGVGRAFAEACCLAVGGLGADMVAAVQAAGHQK